MTSRRASVALTLSIGFASGAWAYECQTYQLPARFLPPPFNSIGGPVDDALRSHSQIHDCALEDVCSATHESGVELAYLDDSGETRVIQARYVIGPGKAPALPFDVKFDDTLWTVAERVLSSGPSFPPLGVYKRQPDEYVVTTDNCLRFPGNANGAVTFYFDGDGRLTSVDVSLPWEGD